MGVIDGDFHLSVEACIRAGLRRWVALPDGTKDRALDDEDAARATTLSPFEPGYVVTEN